MMRHCCAAFLALAAAHVAAQSRPTTAPADVSAEVEQLRAENIALRKRLQEQAARAGNEGMRDFQRKYNALKLDRDRAIEQLAIAQQQIAELRREVDNLRKQAEPAPPAAR